MCIAEKNSVSAHVQGQGGISMTQVREIMGVIHLHTSHLLLVHSRPEFPTVCASITEFTWTNLDAIPHYCNHTCCTVIRQC